MKLYYFIAIIVLIGVLISFTLLFGGEEKGLDKIKKVISNPPQENNPSGENSNSRNSGGGSSGSSGAGSTSSNTVTGQTTSENCAESQISYSLTNFQTNSNCITFENEVCTNKDVSCSLDVNNLDSQTSGNFVINFRFFNYANSELIEERQISNFVEAQNSQLFTTTINIQSQGADGNANQEISCSFSSVEIPRREICG